MKTKLCETCGSNTTEDRKVCTECELSGANPVVSASVKKVKYSQPGFETIEEYEVFCQFLDGQNYPAIKVAPGCEDLANYISNLLNIKAIRIKGGTGRILKI